MYNNSFYCQIDHVNRLPQTFQYFFFFVFFLRIFSSLHAFPLKRLWFKHVSLTSHFRSIILTVLSQSFSWTGCPGRDSWRRYCRHSSAHFWWTWSTLCASWFPRWPTLRTISQYLTSGALYCRKFPLDGVPLLFGIAELWKRWAPLGWRCCCRIAQRSRTIGAGWSSKPRRVPSRCASYRVNSMWHHQD